MKRISEQTMKFLKLSYTDAVYNFADDPDEVCDSPAEAVQHYHLLLHVGKECGLDFWEVAKKEMLGNDARLDRLRIYLGL